MPTPEVASFTRFGPGESAAIGQFQPGDFILTHGDSFFSRLIRLGQGLRFLGRNRGYARWSHAALIVSADGEIVEAIGAGVCKSHLRDYRDVEYHLVPIGSLADDRDRGQMVRFAESCRGLEYGFTICISIALSLLTGVKFRFGFDGEYICSGLVARALERTDIILPRSPSHTLPADLARYFQIKADPFLPKRAPRRKRIDQRS
jgi:hypothetical protein